MSLWLLTLVPSNAYPALNLAHPILFCPLQDEASDHTWHCDLKCLHPQKKRACLVPSGMQEQGECDVGLAAHGMPRGPSTQLLLGLFLLRGPIRDRRDSSDPSAQYVFLGSGCLQKQPQRVNMAGKHLLKTNNYRKDENHKGLFRSENSLKSMSGV